MYMSSAHDAHADFLTENSCAQSQCSDWKFCAETCIKNYIKHVKLKKKNFVKWWQLYEISASFYQSTICAVSQIFCAIVWLHDCSFLKRCAHDTFHAWSGPMTHIKPVTHYLLYETPPNAPLLHLFTEASLTSRNVSLSYQTGIPNCPITAWWTLYTVQYSAHYSVQCRLYCTLHTVHYRVNCTLYSAVYTVE